MRALKAVAAIAVVAGVGIGLTACHSAVPTKQDLLGTWSHDDSKASIVLSGDGRCEMQNFPDHVLLRKTETTEETLSVGCTWFRGDELKRLRDYNGIPIVTITFDKDVPAPIPGITLSVEGDGKSTELYVPLGDADSDERYALSRTDH